MKKVLLVCSCGGKVIPRLEIQREGGFEWGALYNVGYCNKCSKQVRLSVSEETRPTGEKETGNDQMYLDGVKGTTEDKIDEFFINTIGIREENGEPIIYIIDSIDDEALKETKDFILELVSQARKEGECKHIWKKQKYEKVVITHHSEGIGDETKGEVLEGTLWEYCEKCGERRREPEKQEELKELIVDYAFNYRWHFNNTNNKEYVPTAEDLKNQMEDIVGRVDQLLSERTFTKEELATIYLLVKERDRNIIDVFKEGKLPNSTKEKSRNLLNRVSKLLER